MTDSKISVVDGRWQMAESQQLAISADIRAAISEYGAAILHKIGHGGKN
ncbi:hypothetical protein A2U01_0109789, partial [Trifolium medium]|nr:hypothetical protein [Trifolium medium]